MSQSLFGLAAATACSYTSFFLLLVALFKVGRLDLLFQGLLRRRVCYNRVVFLGDAVRRGSRHFFVLDFLSLHALFYFST